MHVKEADSRMLIADDPSASGQLEVLKQSYVLCTEKSPSCKEARRAANAIEAMMRQFELEKQHCWRSFTHSEKHRPQHVELVLYS